jgi:hypothetical protein
LSGLGSGAFNSIIKSLTPEMKAKRQANSPAALAQIKAGGQQKVVQQKADLGARNKALEQEQDFTNRAAERIVDHAIITSGEPEETQGEPGGAGFGGSEIAG